MKIKEKIIEILKGKFDAKETSRLKVLFELDGEITDVPLDMAEVVLKDGTKLSYEGETPEVDAPIFMIGEDGEKTPASDGEHELEDGTILVVVAGVISEVRAVAVEEEMSEDLTKRVKDLEEALKSSDVSEKVEQLEAKLKERETDIKVLSAVMQKFMELPVGDEEAPKDVEHKGYSVSEVRRSFREDIRSMNRRGDTPPTKAPKKKESVDRTAMLEEKFNKLNNN